MMNEYEIHEIIKKQLCKEASQIAESIQKNQTMSIQDLEKLDKIYHLKKDMQTSMAMEEAEKYSEGGMSGENNQNGNSGYRGRAMNGRFVSRSENSYADGYNQGYSEAMNQQSGRSNNSYMSGYGQGYSDAMNNSGHYPVPYPDRRW